MNNKLSTEKTKWYSSVVLALLLMFLMPGNPSSFSQQDTSLTNGTQSTVQIAKSSTNSYNIINDETALVGAFDTIYTITGSSDSLNKSKELVTSLILDDFDNSPVLGYIKAENVTQVYDTGNQTGEARPSIANPFVDMGTINATINEELSNTIDSAHGLGFASVAIKCDFGMNINDWKCEEHGLYQ